MPIDYSTYNMLETLSDMLEMICFTTDDLLVLFFVILKMF